MERTHTRRVLDQLIGKTFIAAKNSLCTKDSPYYAYDERTLHIAWDSAIESVVVRVVRTLVSFSSGKEIVRRDDLLGEMDTAQFSRDLNVEDSLLASLICHAVDACFGLEKFNPHDILELDRIRYAVSVVHTPFIGLKVIRIDDLPAAQTTIGKKWLDRQKAARVERAVGGEKLHAEAEAKRAATVISKIPALIDSAPDYAESVDVNFTVGWCDVSGEGDDRVENLGRRLSAEKRGLYRTDLAGAALSVFDYCDQNGLECFLVSESVPLHENDLNLHVRPKLS